MTRYYTATFCPKDMPAQDADKMGQIITALVDLSTRGLLVLDVKEVAPRSAPRRTKPKPAQPLNSQAIRKKMSRQMAAIHNYLVAQPEPASAAEIVRHFALAATPIPAYSISTQLRRMEARGYIVSVMPAPPRVKPCLWTARGAPAAPTAPPAPGTPLPASYAALKASRDL